MRLVVLLAVVAACGDDAAPVSDAPLAAFCDGNPHELGIDIVKAVAADATGGLVVLGTKFTPSQTIALVRLMPDGAIDTAFGKDGIVHVLDPARTEGTSLVIALDGSIVIGGWYDRSGTMAPFVIGFTATGQPSGLEIRLLQDGTIDQLWLQGSSIVFNIDGNLSRMSMAGQPDANFGTADGKVFVGQAVTPTTSGFAVATRQIDLYNVYRLDPNGMNPGSVVMVPAEDAFAEHIAMARGDRVTFLGTASNASAGFDLVIGRVSGTGEVEGVSKLPGLGQPIAAAELPDDSLLLATGSSMVVVKPDRTIDHMLTVANGGVTAVGAWGDHRVAAGTRSLTGFIACE